MEQPPAGWSLIGQKRVLGVTLCGRSDRGYPDHSQPESCLARRGGGRRRAAPCAYRRRKGFEVKKKVGLYRLSDARYWLHMAIGGRRASMRLPDARYWLHMAIGARRAGSCRWAALNHVRSKFRAHAFYTSTVST